MVVNKKMGESYRPLEVLQGLAEQNDMKLHTDYIGRNMYGKQCVGISGTFAQFYQFVLDLSWEDGERFGMDQAPSQDQLGHDSIWYWPSVQAEEL